MANGALPPQPAKKYLCMPGWVYSNQDRQTHRIPASRLPALYNVDPRECLFGHGDAKMLLALHPYLTLLEPRSDGNYTRP